MCKNRMCSGFAAEQVKFRTGERSEGVMPDAGNDAEKLPVVYELWSDEDLCWIEIACPTIELSAFLEAWCDKNHSIFRRRPYGTRATKRQSHVVHHRLDHYDASA